MPADNTAEVSLLNLPVEEKEDFGDFLIRKNSNLMYIPYPTVLSDGVAFVPVDGIFTQLGASVDSQTSSEVTFTRGKNTVTLYAENSTCTLNGSEMPLASAPISVNGRVYCSVADFESILGLSSVNYNDNLKLLTIRTK